ncbi:recombinase family protein [Yinghuangia sp. ASG 101]|uniref:recombinase family protein n=1 Tax=Yinghuangia sp. ASG 101 TaxID=2896848 RepID=UPI001E4D6043|nr:recombinase family protein [Yinghuangia sp. ASG 101]UGQ14780.1 recombinase family protein [Yinghuangia sp. ASG 101]
MKPLIFGYMRVPDGTSDEEVKQKHDAIAAYAELEGFALEAVFRETVSDRIPAFAELVEAVQRAEARRVVVPSYGDLARTRPLQRAMCLHIAHQTNAQVVSLEGPA